MKEKSPTKKPPALERRGPETVQVRLGYRFFLRKPRAAIPNRPVPSRTEEAGRGTKEILTSPPPLTCELVNESGGIIVVAV